MGQQIKRHYVRDLCRVVWPLLAAIGCLLLIGLLGLGVLTGARAYVAGESMWSKAQKEAVIHLDRYASSGAEDDFERYRKAAAVNRGDKRARLALEQNAPDKKVARQGLIEGRNQPEDISSMIVLFVYFRDYPTFKAAIDVWRTADDYIAQMDDLANALRAEMRMAPADATRIKAVRDAIHVLNDRLAPLEDEFSSLIGQAAREIAQLLGVIGCIVALLLVVCGIFIAQRMLGQLTSLAQFDQLTGLPNRHLFQETLRQAVARARRNQRLVAVLFLDIDCFKQINDTLGHGAGDQVLIEMARRLRTSLRKDDAVARLGGDEFVVIGEGIRTLDDAGVVARKMLANFLQPVRLRDRELFLAASVGIAIFPTDSSDVATLLMHADTAMYRAKSEGHNLVRFYSADMTHGINERLKLEGQLRVALQRNELELCYQPIFELSTGKMQSMEALLRWRHPDWGLVTPLRFIDLAEQTGLIVPIGEWVLQQACAQAANWKQARGFALPIAVNLSARQFSEAGLVALIANTLRQHHISSEQLHIEVTETLVMEDLASSTRQLRELRALGVKVSLDDFGTGYSSMAYLKHFPMDDLKIDREFVKEISRANTTDVAIVRAIIELAHTLGHSVTAEGVESEDQLKCLRELGCDRAQGYLLCRPVAGDVATATLVGPHEMLTQADTRILKSPSLADSLNGYAPRLPSPTIRT